MSISSSSLIHFYSHSWCVCSLVSIVELPWYYSYRWPISYVTVSEKSIPPLTNNGVIEDNTEHCPTNLPGGLPSVPGGYLHPRQAVAVTEGHHTRLPSTREALHISFHTPLQPRREEGAKRGERVGRRRKERARDHK